MVFQRGENCIIDAGNQGNSGCRRPLHHDRVHLAKDEPGESNASSLHHQECPPAGDSTLDTGADKYLAGDRFAE
jgi:hypothetical protein